jgi:glycosyltransferase involved in cell wall biosynthesis
MNIGWLSNVQWAPTGYGNQTALFVPRLRALGHEVQEIANWGLQGNALNVGGHEVLPAFLNNMGLDVLPVYHAKHQFDALITLYDAYVFPPSVTRLFRWVPWTPVDHLEVPPALKTALQSAYQVVAMSRFGQEALARAGIQAAYVPHGVDTRVFRPLPRELARQSAGLPDSPFIVSMVAANKGFPSRKAFPEVLLAWREFHSRHPETLLYLHTWRSASSGGLEIADLLESLGLRDGQSVVFPDPYYYMRSLPNSYVACVYNASSVVLNPSYGEGFGLSIIEAQACGCPVITGGWTSMPELNFLGLTVEGQDWWTLQGAWQRVPRVESILARLEEAYAADREGCVGALRERAMDYDADRVAEVYWKPLLEQIAEWVAGEAPVSLV